MTDHSRGIFSDYLTSLRRISPNARNFLLGNFFVGIGVNLIGLLFNLYLKTISYNESVIGTVLSARALGSTLVTLPAAFFFSRGNLKKFLVSMAVLSGAAYMMQALFTDLGVLLPVVFLSGAFSTVYGVCAGPFFMKNATPGERVFLFSLNGAIGMGTGMLGSISGGLLHDLIGHFTGNPIIAYKVAIGIGTLSILVSTLFFSKIRKHDISEEHHIPPAPLIRDDSGDISTPSTYKADSPALVTDSPEIHRKKSERHVDIALYCKLLLPALLIGIGAGLTIPYINLYFRDVFRLSDGYIGIIYGVSQGFTFVGILAGPILARRIGKARTIVISQALSIPFILLLTYVRFLPLVIVAFFVRNTLMNMAAPLSDNFALERVPDTQRPVINALKMLLWSGSWMLSAKISGSSIYHGGFEQSFTLTAIVYALSTFLFYLFFIRLERKSAETPSIQESSDKTDRC